MPFSNSKIAAEYENFTGTDVRDALHEVLTHYFVWGAARDRLPVACYMFSAEGDELVSSAVARFLQATSDEVAASSRANRGSICCKMRPYKRPGYRYWEL